MNKQTILAVFDRLYTIALQHGYLVAHEYSEFTGGFVKISTFNPSGHGPFVFSIYDHDLDETTRRATALADEIIEFKRIQNG